MSSKLLFLMRGIPGSGKSSIARSIGGDICSADDFFMENGVYKFDLKKIGAAHMYCQAKARALMAKGSEKVIIDNTNTVRREMKVYVALAKEFGYVVQYVSVACNIGLCITRNTHNVPEETIKKMAERFQHENEVPEEPIKESV